MEKILIQEEDLEKALEILSNAYDNLNKSLIAIFAKENINIPFPTTTFDQKN